MSTLSFALIIVAIILLTCLTVNVVNQQKEYATTATLGLGAVAVGALAISNTDSLKSGGVPNIEEAQRRINKWKMKFMYNKIMLWAPPMVLPELDLSGLELEELPNNLPNSLTELDCSNNQLQSLPDNLPNSLTELNCSNNQLQSLPDNLPGSLTHLNCNNNLLELLPQLPEGLVWLDCSGNNIQVLPPLPDSLTYLECRDNNLICLPDLPPPLEYLNLKGNKNLLYPPLDLDIMPPGWEDNPWVHEILRLREWMKANDPPEGCNPPRTKSAMKK